MRAVLIALISFTVCVITTGPATPATFRGSLYGAKIIIDKRSSDFTTIAQPSGYLATLSLSNPAGGEFRLFFDDIVAGSGRFDLVLVTASRVIGTIRSEDLTAKQSFASDAFRGGNFTIKVVAVGIPTGYSFHIRELAYEQPGGAALSISGRDQRVKVSTLAENDHMRVTARSVAKIEYREDGENYVCTGFLVGPNRLITNNHCLGNPATCDSAIAIFGYLAEDAVTEQAHCRRLIKTDAIDDTDIPHHSNLPRHDFALIELDKPMGNNWGTLAFAPNAPSKGTRLYIPQHPDGRTQEVSVVDCVVISGSVQGMVDADSDFSNSCDTEGGSSGSPVVDVATDKVVGLHHLGFSGGYSDVNRAVRADKVSADISP